MNIQGNPEYRRFLIFFDKKFGFEDVIDQKQSISNLKQFLNLPMIIIDSVPPVIISHEFMIIMKVVLS